jgi:2C-methyl-D-erythritol 2,4-cyclodiphosphate synthase
MGGISVYKENTTDGDYAGALGLFTRPNAGSVTKVATISSAGNLGLGVTPSASASADCKQIALGGLTYISSTNGTSGKQNFSTGLYYNAYQTSAGSFNAIVSNSGGDYLPAAYVQLQGQHRWLTASSATAGNAITFTQAMTLDADGDLGIGTSAPSVKLNIAAANPTNGVLSLIQNISTSGQTGAKIQLDVANVGSSGIGIPNGTSNALSFFVGGITSAEERARIDSSGNLLVGVTSGSQITFQRNTDSAAAAVSIINASATTANQYGIFNRLVGDPNNTTNYFLSCVGNATTRMLVYSNGNIVNTNNSYGAISDVKLKENIVDASPKLADLMQVKVRNYNLIGDTTKQLGVVAQELETVFPAMVDESPDKDAEGNDLGTTTKSVKYSVFVPMLVKAIQELKAEFDAYKASHP